MTSNELRALSEALSSLARFCLSTAKIDTLHAEALGELVQLVNNLHTRVGRLEERMAAVEGRLDGLAASRHPVFPRPVA